MSFFYCTFAADYKIVNMSIFKSVPVLYGPPPIDLDRKFIADRPNIVLDLGGVLMQHDREGCLRAFRQFMSDQDIDQVLGLGNDKPCSLRVLFEKGQLPQQAFIDSVLKHCKPGTTEQQIIDAWNAIHAGIPDEVWMKIKLLRNSPKAYRIHLFSNTDQIHWEHVQSLYGDKIKEYFNEVYLSFQYGKMKPDKMFFKQVDYEMCADPKQTYFVDDTETNRLAAEKSVGWQTCANLTELFKILKK